jgi:PH (Pleckstrin Homology) domain-containing protein
MRLLSGLLGNAGVVGVNKLQAEYEQLLVDGETVEIGFLVGRDTFIFTSKRLILVNVQGVSGKRIEYLSLPYGKITKFSVESTGHFDPEAELKIWVGSDSAPLTKKFTSEVSIYDLQKVLAKHLIA